jgi:hypothetical protein
MLPLLLPALQASPVFVSDAMPGDVQATIAWLAARPEAAAAALAARLAAARAAGALLLVAEPFLTSPHPFWRMQPALRHRFAASTLTIVKGDGGWHAGRTD